MSHAEKKTREQSLLTGWESSPRLSTPSRVNRTVPAFVPSLVHSSNEVRDPLPWKNTRLAEALGRTVGLPEQDPRTGSLAEKTRRPWKLVRDSGLDEPGPGQMSATSKVPPGVPSLRQSSVPCSWPGASAAK